jgi:hypothetical protein
MSDQTWLVALVAATGLHLGFQLTITLVTYPALLDTSDESWAGAHADHGRRITPVVGVVYGSLAVAVAGALVTDRSAGTVVAAVGAATAGLATALVAAPTHGRLGTGRTPALVRRLRAADLVRTAGAALALVGALVALAR